MPVAANDFIDYIFKFPDQGSFLRDSTIQQFGPSVPGSNPVIIIYVQLLVYNPVETLQPPVPPIPANVTPVNSPGNALVLVPQLANSTVALSGFWAMVTVKSTTAGTSSALLLEDKSSHLLLEGGGGKLLLEGSSTSSGVISAFANHPNIQIINDRTTMFASKPSVVQTKLDISHINMVINSFGVYVRDGLQLM